MARSKNCLQCHYCKVLGGWTGSKDWVNDWYCDYYTMQHKNGDKGDDPDNCKLFKPRGKRKKYFY